MTVTPKTAWRVTSGGGEPQSAIDSQYSSTWTFRASETPWLEIDLGEAAVLAGLEVYWGKAFLSSYEVRGSLDGRSWARLCGTCHGEGGQDVFAFPPASARFVRWTFGDPRPEGDVEIVEINLYGPNEAARVLETARIGAVGHCPVTVPPGESVTVDLAAERSPLGVFIEWGPAFGTDFSVHLSDDGARFREVGRISTGNGGSDSFWWRSTRSRFIRLTVHATSAPEGAIVNELKLRILNKDRMPIGLLERAALAGPGDLYPQSLLGRQVYWTVLGTFDEEEEALFDEYGNLEPARGSPQLMPMLRLEDGLHAGPECADVERSLAEGALPVPTVAWSVDGVEARVTGLAHALQATVEYRVTNRRDSPATGAIVLAIRPVQINPYWQHGGHAPINAVAVEGASVTVNDETFAVFSRLPDCVAVADFAEGDVIEMIEREPRPTEPTLRSHSGLVSAALEFVFALEPGESFAVAASMPMREGIAPKADVPFATLRADVLRAWREKIGPRKLSVGDREVSDTVEAQTSLILVNATRHAFKPGPRNYDRTWIRDGSSQALALLWADLIDEAKDYVLWYAERVYDNGLVPPILNVDGSVNRGYGSDIEFDAQGEFVGIAADVHRITKDRVFLAEVYPAVVRATRFLEDLCDRTNALFGRDDRRHGLLAPSISHEGYNKPSYSYWDDFFALSAWRNCAYLASESGDAAMAAHAKAKGDAFAADLGRSLRLASLDLGRGLIAASADREDVDPSSTSIAFEPCRVADVLPAEFMTATYDLVAERVKRVQATDFEGTYTPYAIRNINAFIALGRFDDAFRLLAAALACRRPAGWRSWAEVVWSAPRAPDYIGDMPHTWIGAEFATAIRRMLVREQDGVLELFRAVPDSWWAGDGIVLRQMPTAFGDIHLRARRDRLCATVDLSLTGPAPERVTFRYPGAKQARSDGGACAIDGDVISTQNFSRLEIGF